MNTDGSINFFCSSPLLYKSHHKTRLAKRKIRSVLFGNRRNSRLPHTERIVEIILKGRKGLRDEAPSLGGDSVYAARTDMNGIHIFRLKRCQYNLNYLYFNQIGHFSKNEPIDIEKDSMMDTIGSRIAFFRTERGLSRGELARLSGYTRNFIRSIEQWDKRYQNPTIEKIYGIAKALGVHPFHLLDDVFKMASSKEAPRIAIKAYIKMTVGERLKAVRVWRGLSQKDLADQCKMRPEDIKAIEKSSQLTFIQFYQLALALDIPSFWLSPDPPTLEPLKTTLPEDSVKQVISLFKDLTPEQKQNAMLAMIQDLGQMGTLKTQKLSLRGVKRRGNPD